jgi:hypothetical protein
MNKLQKRFIRVADRKQWKLTQWECDFLDSMNEKGEDHELSTKENHVLNQIQRKTT